MPARGTVIVWCDKDTTQPGLHASFKLSAQGEEISLFDRDGKTRLGILKFGAIDTDVSHGRLADGKATPIVAYRRWSTYGIGATPNAVNEPLTGPREYWPIDYKFQRMFVEWVGQARIGGISAIRSLGGPQRQSVALMIASSPAYVSIGGGLSFMIGGVLSEPYLVPTDINGQGVAVINVPNDSKLIGLKVYFQVGGADGAGFTLSNGGQVTISR